MKTLAPNYKPQPSPAGSIEWSDAGIPRSGPKKAEASLAQKSTMSASNGRAPADRRGRKGKR